MTRKANITIVLIAINVLIFLIFAMRNNPPSLTFMVNHGAMFEPAIIEGREYYRFITSMFLHFDINHLLNNMLMLGVLGHNIELEMGKIRLLIIYVISGIGGNFLSLWWNMTTGQNVVSAGASGAIFGLLGALLGVLMKQRRPIARLSTRGMLVMVGFSLYVGLTSSGVDNAAHIGGLICGFLVAICLVRK